MSGTVFCILQHFYSLSSFHLFVFRLYLWQSFKISKIQKKIEPLKKVQNNKIKNGADFGLIELHHGR